MHYTIWAYKLFHSNTLLLDKVGKEMATHSSILGWKIPWEEEAGRLQSMGSQRVGQDWVTSLSLWIRRETCSSNFISVRKYQVKCTSNNFKPKWVQDQFVLCLEMTVCTHWIGIWKLKVQAPEKTITPKKEKKKKMEPSLICC